MYQSGQFDVASIRKENPNIDIGVMTIPHPEGKETAAILGGWSFVVPKDAKNPDEAKKFVQFLAAVRQHGLLHRHLPGAHLGDGAAALRRPDPRASSRRCCRYGRPVPAHKNWVQITQAYFDGIQRILLGDEDAADRDGRRRRGDPGAARRVSSAAPRRHRRRDRSSPSGIDPCRADRPDCSSPCRR